ncbi:MAG TPA: recombinase family protein [Candidatus Saccharimonadales bacterium]|nr:recombinase family protein [Candidatus Saccharimonadales bacterium]
MPHAAAIYARISQDRDGSLLGVTRQIDDCSADAARRGWPIAEVYVDDDVSAYGGKHRPAYRRMLEDIRDRRVDAVVVWHLDRLHRHPRELEEFFEVCERAGVSQLASVSGDVDLSTGEGQFYARIQGAVARKESDDKSRRAKRKHLEIAQAGRWSGSARAFGYDAAGAIVPEEAAVIREMVARLLAGESLRTLVRDLDARQIPTLRGGRWTMQTLRNILKRPALAGFRTLRGEVVTRGVWAPILSEEESARVRALLADPRRRLTRPARTYLLKGFAYCALCGVKLISRPNHSRRTYLCGSGPSLTGCGRVYIVAEPLEAFITEAVLYRLDTPALRAVLDQPVSGQEDATDVLDALRADEAQLGDLALAYARKQISLPEWLVARTEIEARLGQQRARLQRTDDHRALRELAGGGDPLRRRWPDLNLDQRRAIIATVLDRVAVSRSRLRGRVQFDPGRLDPVWKV